MSTTDRRFKAAFQTSETKMVTSIITSKLNSTFGTIGKATGTKMTAKAVGKSSSFRVSVENNLNMPSCSRAHLQNFEQFLAFK